MMKLVLDAPKMLRFAITLLKRDITVTFQEQESSLRHFIFARILGAALVNIFEWWNEGRLMSMRRAYDCI
jgi:hypothetical protein